MSEGGHDGAWYCSQTKDRAVCPQQGCPKGHCEREHGWLPGLPEPDHYTSTPPATQADDAAWAAAVDRLEQSTSRLSKKLGEGLNAVADDVLVEELARALASSDDVPVAAPVGDYARNARAILPIILRREAAAHAAGRAAERALAAVWQQARENHANYSATGDVETDIRFFALGLAGEAGEVANFVKKRWRDGDGHDADLRAEVADVFAYNIMLADALGMTPESLIAEVARKQQVFIEKMKARDAIERGQHKEQKP